MSNSSIPSPMIPEVTTALRERFQRLAGQWNEQSRHLSNPAQMAVLPAYQRIIGMGWPACRASDPGGVAAGTGSVVLGAGGDHRGDPVPPPAAGRVRARWPGRGSNGGKAPGLIGP